MGENTKIAIRPEHLSQDTRRKLGLPSVRCARCGVFAPKIVKCLRCSRNGCGYCLYKVGDGQYTHNCCPLKRSSAKWDHAQRRTIPIALDDLPEITTESAVYLIQNQMCRQCGTVFYLGDHRQRYCQPCRESRASYRRAKPRPVTIRPCHQCGVDFETANRQVHYCPNCPPIQIRDGQLRLRRHPNQVIRDAGSYEASPYYANREATS